VIWAAAEDSKAVELAKVNPDAMPINLDLGAPGLSRWLAAIRTRASILMIVAHPDDEDGGLLAMQTRGLGARGALMTLNRGEGGQNAMSMDMYDALGLVRTEELLDADRYYGVEQYWGRAIDYGFSKTREEALDKWGYERTLSDVVRVVRMTHPLVLTSVFIGAPTDGHGNHQVAGEMAQEAFVAAGDPTKFPEQIREGLRPWQPLKVYERVPFFQPTKDKTIYDYATDQYVPIRFYNYITKTWSTETPAANIGIPEGTLDAATGYTFLQMGREGWGYQKSQNGGGTIPQPNFQTIQYHRYGSKVTVPEKENSLYEGIDISLDGIATLAEGDTTFLKQGLEHISKCADEAFNSYKPDDPAGIAPILADGLNATRELVGKVNASSLSEPGKSNVVFELNAKTKQFERALTLALGLNFDAVVAPEHEPSGPLAAFAGTSTTFTIATPGQAFPVETRIVNDGKEPVLVNATEIEPSDGKAWTIKSEQNAPVSGPLASNNNLRVRFGVRAPEDAALTRPYFTRPNLEQAYYDLTDERFRNLSFGPYPLYATARITYDGAEITLTKAVQTNQRVEQIGIVEDPLLMAPAISVTVSPGAGAVPLNSTSFNFSCTLHTNVKGTSKGVLRLDLPAGWESKPAQHDFAFARDGENSTFAFEVTPKSIGQQAYEIRAIAEYNGHKYEEGYHLTGYPGLRPYPLYRAATYKAVGVDVKTAPNLRIGFLPGTGDDVPRALEDLGLHVTTLSTNDLESADLSVYDAIVLGVRAYAVRPELRSANNRLLQYVNGGGVLLVQYNLQNFDHDYGPYPFELGNNPQKVVDEGSQVKFLTAGPPVFAWPNKISESDFTGWEEERGHGFMSKWDPHYQALVETHDPGQDPQSGGLLIAKYGKGFYIYDAFALYRQLPAGVPGAYRILANLVSLGKNPEWK
jgi:LmbE family N-acetylglucosaminyl deacetylase